MIIDIESLKLIDIIAISGDAEALAIRAQLESVGFQTRLHYIGNVKHLMSLFQKTGYLHNIVIISCHGNEKGLIIPDLSPELEKQMPYSKILTSSNLYDNLSLNNQIIINTGCCLGGKKFAESFLSKGAKAYIGAAGYIEGSAILLFITIFFYFYSTKGASIEESFEKGTTIDQETSLIKLWQASNLKLKEEN